MRFTDPGNIDNDDVIASIGYNYALSKKDTLRVLYRFTAYHFTGNHRRLAIMPLIWLMDEKLPDGLDWDFLPDRKLLHLGFRSAPRHNRPTYR